MAQRQRRYPGPAPPLNRIISPLQHIFFRRPNGTKDKTDTRDRQTNHRAHHDKESGLKERIAHLDQPKEERIPLIQREKRPSHPIRGR